MPQRIYFLDSGKKEKLDICWKGFYKNLTVKIDNKELGVFKSKKELREGRAFDINYNKKLKVRLVNEFGIFPCIEILMNGRPVTGTMTDPQKQLTDIFYVILLIAALNFIVGLTWIIFKIKAFEDHGLGLNTIVYGAIFLMMGFIIYKRQSLIALIVVITLLMLDIIYVVAHSAEYAVQSNPWSTITIKILIILYICRGFLAFKRLRQLKELQAKQEQIELQKKQRDPLLQKETKDHTSFMPKDNSRYMPDL